jgi:serine/threonine protein kinase
MWCLGNMLAAMIFRKEPFFSGSSLTDQLIKIAIVLGSDRIYDFVEQYQITMYPEDREALGHWDGEPWENFKNEGNQHLATMEAISFVDRLLQVDPAVRASLILRSYTDRVLGATDRQRSSFRFLLRRSGFSSNWVSDDYNVVVSAANKSGSDYYHTYFHCDFNPLSGWSA